MTEKKPHPGQAGLNGRFNPGAALAFARRLARPRRAGSGEDLEIAAEIATHLEASGWRLTRHPFSFSPLLDRLVSLELLAAIGLLSIALLSRKQLPALAGLAVVGLLALGTLSGRWHGWAQTVAVRPAGAGGTPGSLRARLWPGPSMQTANLVAEFSEIGRRQAAPHLLLVAHYDSKSQRLSLPARISLLAAFLVGGLGFSALMLAELVLKTRWEITAVLGMLALIACLPLIFRHVGDRSPGAVDNASGVGLVIGLAECLSRRPDLRERLHVSLLFTSAEEYGLLGAHAYLEEHLPRRLNLSTKNEPYVLNFDGVGVAGRLSLVGNQSGDLAAAVLAASRQLRVPLLRMGIFGAMLDHQPFARQGLQAASLITIGRAALSIHTPADTPAWLDESSFQTVGALAMAAIEHLAARS